MSVLVPVEERVLDVLHRDEWLDRDVVVAQARGDRSIVAEVLLELVQAGVVERQDKAVGLRGGRPKSQYRLRVRNRRVAGGGIAC